MHFNPLVVVDSVFVMAILTVLGYSVNDTIIIFDRIRENIIKYQDQLKK
jgi:preprotein translocase subunit SecF